ncbi:MAG: VOC family protein [Aggregatilineales bacterium]
MSISGIDKKNISQVCLIVEDVEMMVENYRQILGWQIPADFQITHLYDHTEAEYYGEPTDARAKISGFDLGGIQYELLQPLEERSSWYDFLNKNGDGIHHFAFFVPKTEPVVESFIQHGYQVIHSGLFTGRSGRYTYLDTDRDLGIIIELLEHFGGSPSPKGPEFPKERGIGTDIVTQVGIIVHDIEATAQRLSNLLGVPEPTIIETPGYDISKTTYKGEKSDSTAKLAFFNTGQVQLELIEPDHQPSVWRDWLNEHGEGAQHIALNIKDTKKVVDYLGGHGIEVLQQGLYADGSGMYTYVDSQIKLGTTLELLENF